MKKIQKILTRLAKNKNYHHGYIILLATLIVISQISFLVRFSSDHNFILWKHIDIVIVSFFIAEYIGLFLFSKKKWKFVFSPIGIIDLLVIISFFPSFLSISGIRSLRFFRLLQLMKLLKHSYFIQILIQASQKYRQEFRLLFVHFLIFVTLNASLILHFEHEKNELISSIQDAFWWSIVTMGTIGYGDIIPITNAGKFFSGFVIIVGIGFIAIFTALITKIFIDDIFGKSEYICRKCHRISHDKNARYCKICGKKLFLV